MKKNHRYSADPGQITKYLKSKGLAKASRTEPGFEVRGYPSFTAIDTADARLLPATRQRMAKEIEAHLIERFGQDRVESDGFLHIRVAVGVWSHPR